MKKAPKASAKAEPAPDTANNEAAEESVPEVPQTGYGKFEYINQTVYVGEWQLKKGRKVKHGTGKITFPGVHS